MAAPKHTAATILLVDDVEDWRRSICSMLENRPELHVVGEAVDGFEAVQKTPFSTHIPTPAVLQF
jgi:chemotaxis response regulator CheB